MNCGGTELTGSSGPLSEVISIQKNGKTVMTARNVRRTYQSAPLAIALGCRRRDCARSRWIRATGSMSWPISALGHVSAPCPRSRRRTLTTEKTKVIARRAMAIADAYPAWPSWNACFQR